MVTTPLLKPNITAKTSASATEPRCAISTTSAATSSHNAAIPMVRDENRLPNENSMMRPVTCIGPKNDPTHTAVSSARPLPCSTVIRCIVSTDTMKPLRANAIASAMKAPRRDRMESVPASGVAPALPDPSGDAGRGTSRRCSGRQTATCNAAKNIMVSRQPNHSSPFSDVGQNTVLARPPISVSAVSAVR